MSEIIEIKQAEVLQAINRSEIDMQVSTAKQYPRNLPEVLNKIATYATMDKETAEDCFYVLRRNGQSGSSTIEGLSVRMAEIIAGAWGNLRVQTRIVGNDGKTITAQGICHDLETNVAVSVEVKRKGVDGMREKVQNLKMSEVAKFSADLAKNLFMYITDIDGQVSDKYAKALLSSCGCTAAVIKRLSDNRHDWVGSIFCEFTHTMGVKEEEARTIMHEAAMSIQYLLPEYKE